MLADELIERGRPDRVFGYILLDMPGGYDTRSGVVHRANSSKPSLIRTSAVASLPSRRAAAAIAPTASVRLTPRFSNADTASVTGPTPFIGSPDNADTGGLAAVAMLPSLSRNSLTMRAASRRPALSSTDKTNHARRHR